MNSKQTNKDARLNRARLATLQFYPPMMELDNWAGSEEMRRMLSTLEKAQATARWFVQQGILQQFNLATEVEEEDTGNYASFIPLEGANQDSL
jgi:hypothetical protein